MKASQPHTMSLPHHLQKFQWLRNLCSTNKTGYGNKKKEKTMNDDE
jgi:hypothetical protein